MNLHESEKLAGILIENGYVETSTMQSADIIVFNTCCIRDGVEKKILGNISIVKPLKKQNPKLIVVVCGCMTQLENNVELLKQKFRYVNIVFGTHNLYEFNNYLKEYNKSQKNIYNIWKNENLLIENTPTYRASGNNAWVNIILGCNNFCSYCIVPFVRGRERSRSIKEIIDDVKKLVHNGYKYITLLGQNVNSYGNDFDDKTINFAFLLKELCKIKGNFKIKFLTSHPKDLNDEVIDVIAENQKLCKVIHLPIQSGSNEILKKMNRKYTVEHYLSLIKKIREKIPDCYISTDIIVGFPGESNEDFNHTLKLINDIKFDGVFAFMYSKRTGTKAAIMGNQISEEIKRERVNSVLKASKTITKNKDINSKGKIFNVIVEEKIDKNLYTTLSDSGKTIKIISTDNLELNQFYSVVITAIKDNKLFGKLLKRI